MATSSEPRRFVLQRDVDETGVSGTGVVAEGIEFSDGVVALRWVGLTPTSVVFHDNGIESVEAVHGHGGNTKVVFLDDRDEPVEADEEGPGPNNTVNVNVDTDQLVNYVFDRFMKIWESEVKAGRRYR